MTNEQFQIFLDRHGADPARWPEVERAAAERLVAHEPEARALLQAAQRLDAALARHGQNVAAGAADAAAVARVLAKLPKPLPRQRAPFWRLPSVLLDWQFAPAWPRMAALGACLAFGFFIGISSLDRFDSPFVTAGRTDLSAVVFEPEALTGARP